VKARGAGISAECRTNETTAKMFERHTGLDKAVKPIYGKGDNILSFWRFPGRDVRRPNDFFLLS